MIIFETAQQVYHSSIGNTEVVFVLKILLSAALGLLIGQERHQRGKSAGRSTFSFVILGAMIFSYISGIVRNADNSRIAAQIVSGIGFLGAGLIFVSRENQVRNLTTAAGIWVAGAIGMAIGFGYYFVAIATTITVRALPKIFDRYGDHEDLKELKKKAKKSLDIQKNTQDD